MAAKNYFILIFFMVFACSGGRKQNSNMNIKYKLFDEISLTGIKPNETGEHPYIEISDVKNQRYVKSVWNDSLSLVDTFFLEKGHFQTQETEDHVSWEITNRIVYYDTMFVSSSIRKNKKTNELFLVGASIGRKGYRESFAFSMSEKYGTKYEPGMENNPAAMKLKCKQYQQIKYQVSSGVLTYEETTYFKEDAFAIPYVQRSCYHIGDLDYYWWSKFGMFMPEVGCL